MAYATINKPSDYFNTKLYTGTGAEQSITGVGFQPDLTWIKNRTSDADWHRLLDSVRGATKELYSNDSAAEITQAQSLKSFNSDGFTLGTLEEVNTNTEAYASWNWLAGGTASSNTDGSITSSVSVNTTAGFSIVSFTGNATNDATIGHGLGTTPAMIITKNRIDDVNWRVWHKDLTALHVLFLSGTVAESSPGAQANGYIKTVNSSTYSVYAGNTNLEGVNGSGDAMISYCFAEVKGFSKFGSYIANANTDGPFVYTGFKPAFIIAKNINLEQTWIMIDNKRDSFNEVSKLLAPNTANSEADSSGNAGTDFLSNGFKIRAVGTGDLNYSSGHKYVYMAFAEAPLVGTNKIPVTAR